jgi:filamentous hemagglutinin family protein
MHPVTRVWHILVLPVKLLLALVTYQPLALALPQGGVVTQGAAVIQQESPTKLNIHQSSDRAIINWHSFSIGAPEWVNFQQPSSTSATLNRVTGNTPSSIAGKLTANGQIFLINPNGIAFLPTAQVDVAGLVASTLNIKDSDFMRGVWRFEQMPGKPPASVTNEGLITVKEAGFAALVAPAVQNSGVISARLGKVVLASGTTVSLDFYGDGLLSVTVDPQLAGQITDIYGNKLSSLINNQGIITAPGGMVTLSAQAAGQIVDRVINTGGIIEAKYAENRNGVIVLSGGSKGIVAVNGVLDVSGEKGGKVQITGENVGLFGSAKVDASGDKAGGLVLLGGDYLGGRADKQRIDPSLNAQNTYVSSGSVIHADAKVTGDGGEVIVWADNFTRFDGTITARGDNGGFVETSGKNILQVGDSARVDTTGRTGKTGTWLLDPLDLTIMPVGGLPPGINVTAGSPFTPTAPGSILWDATINNALQTNNVVVTTVATPDSGNGDIIFASGADVNWSTANTLTVQAARRIVMQPGSKITNTKTGTFDAVIFQSNVDNITGNFSGIELNSSTISTQGGNIQLIGKGGNMGSNNYGIYQHSGTKVTSATGNITYEGTGGNGGLDNYGVLLQDTNTKISSGSGAISITGIGKGSSINNHGIWQKGGAQVQTTSGDITYIGTAGNGVNSNHGVRLQGADTKIISDTGTITIIGNGQGSGNGNYGIFQQQGAQVKTTSGNIIYTGTGANAGSTNIGVFLSSQDTVISSDTGEIKITGIGQGSGNFNYGILQQNKAQVFTTTNLSGKGNITYEGTGGNGTDTNLGVLLFGIDTKIITDAGAIKITGTGQGSTEFNYGIAQQQGAQVISTSGNITYTGNGGNGTNYNYGIYFTGTDTQTKSDTGTISIIGQGNGSGFKNYGIFQKNQAQVITTVGNITYQGTGGSGTSDNYGVLLQDANTKITSSSGAISITGNGKGTGDANYGIWQKDQAQVSTTSGTITYEGTGGNGANFNHGVYLTGLNTAITSNSGAIEIKGKGQGSSLINYGIWQNDQAQVNTISGNITYKGTGGNGTISNEGVRLEGTNTKITSNTGAIEVTGIGGGSLGNGNFGIHQLNGAEVQTTSGNITYDGKGADAGSTNHGVVLAGANTKITSDTGAISITGQGQGNGNSNFGIYQYNGAQVSTTTNISGKGNITYTGTGGNGAGGFNYGVNLLGSSTKISTDAGEIKITGKGQGTGSGNIGIYQVIDTEVSSKAGDIIYIGKGANSAPAIATAVGTNLIGNGTTGEIRLISNGGNINLDNVTIQSNGEDVIIVSDHTVRQNSASKILANGLALKGSGIGANYILNAPNNDVNFFAANVIGGVTYQDVNTLTLDTVTSTALALTVTGFTTGNGDGIIRTGNTLTLNKATNLGTGNLTLKSGGGVTQNANGQIIAKGLGLQGSSNFILNNSNNNIDVFAAQVTGDVSLVNSDTVTVNKVTSTVTLDTLTTTAVTATGTIFIQTKTGNIVLNESVSSSSGNITLVAEDNFINNVGAGALSAPNGKWLVYATSPAGNVNGWPVLGGSEQFNTTYPQPPLFTGNGFLYKVGLPIPDVNLTQPITFSFNEQGWFDFGSREITVFLETLLCVTVPVNQEEEEAQTFTLFQPATEAPFRSRFETYETYWWPGKFPECKGQIDGLSSR